MSGIFPDDAELAELRARDDESRVTACILRRKPSSQARGPDNAPLDIPADPHGWPETDLFCRIAPMGIDRQAPEAAGIVAVRDRYLVYLPFGTVAHKDDYLEIGADRFLVLSVHAPRTFSLSTLLFVEKQ